MSQYRSAYRAQPCSVRLAGTRGIVEGSDEQGGRGLPGGGAGAARWAACSSGVWFARNFPFWVSEDRHNLLPHITPPFA
jgi:hypothetical protein